jgi:putative spermidine/putrescine transport system permease protein
MSSAEVQGRVRDSGHRTGRRAARERWWSVTVPLVGFLGVIFIYPTAIIMLRAFTRFDAPQVSGWDNISWALSTSVNRTILIRTFVVAALTTTITLLIAFPYAYTLTIVSERVRTLMMSAVLISMFFGILLRNFSWIVLLQREGALNDALAWLGFSRRTFLGTMPAVLMGMTHVLFPFMVLPLYSVLRSIDRRLLLAAQSLGATPSTAFRQVYLPLAVPGIFGGSVLVFVLSLGFFITPSLLGSPQQSLVSQLIYQQFRRSASFGRAGALSIVLLIAAVVVVVSAQLIVRRSRAYGEPR